jgi:hypothetical protein
MTRENSMIQYGRKFYAFIMLGLLVLPAQQVFAIDSTALELLTLTARQEAARFKSTMIKTRRMEIDTLGESATSSVCKMTAPRIYQEYSSRYNIVLKRVSLRPRNAVTGHADAWEQAGLLAMQQKLAEGVDTGKIEIAELVEEPAGKYFRYLSPIFVEPGCLACHGTENDMDRETARTIQLTYPGDLATGYRVGDLIGAVSIIRRIDPEGSWQKEVRRNLYDGHDKYEKHDPLTGEINGKYHDGKNAH